jgi:biotin transport system substrate-specific component
VFQGFQSAFQVYYTAGYLVGFPIAAFIAGWFTRSNREQSLVLALLTALIVFLVADALVFALGYGWLGSLIGYDKAWAAGVAPFLFWDAVKVALAALITTGAWRTFGGKA